MVLAEAIDVMCKRIGCRLAKKLRKAKQVTDHCPTSYGLPVDLSNGGSDPPLVCNMLHNRKQIGVML